MPRAIWNGAVLAESPHTEVLEGNHYFPPEAVNKNYLLPSNTTTMCSWKGQANYYSLIVGGDLNPDAVWYYADPKPGAEQIKGRVAFQQSVAVQA